MLIRKMVEIYSPSGSEGKLVEFLIEWAKNKGFNAYRDEVGNFIAEKGKECKILMVGHVDTVPGEIPVRIEDDNLYGRGSVDAKGALASFLEAAADIEDGIVIVGAVDEERESTGARNILGKFNPEFIIVGEPSGWCSLNIGYKGRINLFYLNRKDKKHGSTPEKNANEEAIDFFNKLKNCCDNFNEKKSFFNKIGIKLISINSEDNGIIESIRMTINFRIPPEFDIKKLKDFIEKIKGDASVFYSSFEKPVRVEKKNKLISSFIRAIREEGGKVRFKLKSGTSDMNILQSYNVPMVTYGPGNSSLDHTPNEHLNLKEYRKAVKVLRKVLKDLLS